MSFVYILNDKTLRQKKNDGTFDCTSLTNLLIVVIKIVQLIPTMNIPIKTILSQLQHLSCLYRADFFFFVNLQFVVLQMSQTMYSFESKTFKFSLSF